MAIKYYTSDFHFGSVILLDRTVIGNSKNGRDFKNLDEMHRAILNAMRRANTKDTIIHLGDLACLGKDRSYKGIKNREALMKLIDSVHCNKIFLEGNHDMNNCGFCHGKALVDKIGPWFVTLQHFPSSSGKQYIDLGYRTNIRVFGKKLGINICGHVHSAWKVQFDFNRCILNINVGLDCNNFRMYSESELVHLITSGLEYVKYLEVIFPKSSISYSDWMSKIAAEKAAANKEKRLKTIRWKMENKPYLVTAAELELLKKMK